MNVNRGLIVAAVAFAIGYALERQFDSIVKDMKRYDGLRAMSGDKPFLIEQLENLGGMMSSAASDRAGLALGMVESIQNDIVRYAKLKRM